MNAELKEKWVKALRSGEYKQGKGCLLKSGEFCCLGVLGDQCPGITWYLAPGQQAYGLQYGDSVGQGNLPTELTFDIGLERRVIRVLVDMNDNQGKTFKQIADWIEEENL